MTNGSITGYYTNLTRSVKTDTMARGHEVLFAATSDLLPSYVALHSLLDDWGGDHWLPQIGPRVPLAMVSVFTDLVRLV